ncbi:MAG: hypothetical protein IKI34_02950, partial [Eubacterium sp.]|nr:hypothetical protein [Eubacterium sp.]
MKQTKRLISVILALLMIISGAPLTALADEPQSDISGNFTYEENEKYNLNWVYTAETDTLFLDANIVGSLDLEEGVNHLPLYYTDTNGNQVLWRGTYSNIEFGESVETLTRRCLGNDLLDGRALNVSFEGCPNLSAVWNYAFSDYKFEEMRLPNTISHYGG